MEHDRHAYLNAANVSATPFKDAMILLLELGEWI